ncbi:MAG: hypothetical protein RBS37_09200 [Bacteroidales bacterium]|jgi:hypothetical protein|nr:hypothetical protein [Bacteroidales bacterium]
MNKHTIYISLVIPALILAAGTKAWAQPVPGEVENIPYLITFGKDGQTSWGDDDFSQTFFFTIPLDYRQPFYIRVFDPDIGGEHDEINGYWDTRMLYSVYGGAGCYTHEEARGIDPTGNYKSGTLLYSRAFVMEERYDNQWYTFGPINPTEGEFVERYQSYFFKIVCDGVSGDDGNTYRYFLSREAEANRPIEGANAFTYEYTFRMWNDTTNVMHIYPFVDTMCVFVKVVNFDWDSDGTILAVSEVRKGQLLKISAEDEWAEDRITVDPREINKSYDFQFHKRKDFLVRNNNVVVRVENQYGDVLKFFTVPIGGIPVYNPRINVVKKNKQP